MGPRARRSTGMGDDENSSSVLTSLVGLNTQVMMTCNLAGVDWLPSSPLTSLQLDVKRYSCGGSSSATTNNVRIEIELDRIISIEDAAAYNISEQSSVANWTSRHRALISCTGDNSSSSSDTSNTNAFEKLMKHLFELNAGARGFAIISGPVPCCFAVTVYAIGKGKANLMITGHGEKDRMSSRLNTSVQNGLYLQDDGSSMMGPGGKERPKRESASRTLLQLAASTQGAAGLECLHLDEQAMEDSHGGMHKWLPSSGNSTSHITANRFPDPLHNSIVTGVASPMESSLDYSMSVAADSIVHQDSHHGFQPSAAEEKGFSGRLFQSVMGSFASQQVNTSNNVGKGDFEQVVDYSGNESARKSSATVDITDGESPTPKPDATSSNVATGNSDTQSIQNRTPVQANSSRVTIVPQLSQSEESSRLQLVKNCLMKYVSKAGKPGKGTGTHCLQKYTHFRTYLDECLLSRTTNPTQTAVYCEDLLHAAVQASGSRQWENSEAHVSRALGAYRRMISALQRISSARIRGSRGLSTSVSSACVLIVLLSLQLVRLAQNKNHENSKNISGSIGNCYAGLNKDIQKASSAVTNALERLALMMAPGAGMLRDEDVCWILQLPPTADVAPDRGTTKKNVTGGGYSSSDDHVITKERSDESSSNIGLIGNYNNAESSRSEAASHTGTSDRGEVSTSPGDVGNALSTDTVVPSVHTLLAYCRSHFAGFSLCITVVDEAVEALSLSSSENSPASSPDVRVRRKYTNDSTSTLAGESTNAGTSSSILEKLANSSNDTDVVDSLVAGGVPSPKVPQSGVQNSNENSGEKSTKLDGFDSEYTDTGTDTGAGFNCPPPPAPTLRRTNSILATKAAVSQRTNNATKRQVTVTASDKKTVTKKLSTSATSTSAGRRLSATMQPPQTSVPSKMQTNARQPQSPRVKTSKSCFVVPDTPASASFNSFIPDTPCGPSISAIVPETPHEQMNVGGGGSYGAIRKSNGGYPVPSTPLQRENVSSLVAVHKSQAKSVSSRPRNSRLSLGILSKATDTFLEPSSISNSKVGSNSSMLALNTPVQSKKIQVSMRKTASDVKRAGSSTELAKRFRRDAEQDFDSLSPARNITTNPFKKSRNENNGNKL
jgi:hypothetical protein